MWAATKKSTEREHSPSIAAPAADMSKIYPESIQKSSLIDMWARVAIAEPVLFLVAAQINRSARTAIAVVSWEAIGLAIGVRKGLCVMERVPSPSIAAPVLFLVAAQIKKCDNHPYSKVS
jgi:hypothetical protein